MSDLRLDTELDRIMFEFTEEPIMVKFIKEFPGFKCEGIELHSCSEGSQQSIPLFFAQTLLNNGMIDDFWENFSVDVDKLVNYLREEKRSGELNSLNNFLMMSVQKKYQKQKEELTDYQELENKKVKSTYEKLLAERIPKIAKIASMELGRRSKRPFTRSEELLFKKLKNLIQDWKKEMISKLEVDE